MAQSTDQLPVKMIKESHEMAFLLAGPRTPSNFPTSVS